MRSEENRISEATLSGEILADGGTQEDQLDKAISNDNQCEDLNSSLTFDLPAPEKLLFAPQRPLDRPHDLLVETPDKQVQEEGDESGLGTKISVRKRSLTESSLTVQSVNSVESFSMTKSTRTLDSIPDDDDLLSSILGIMSFTVSFNMLGYLLSNVDFHKNIIDRIKLFSFPVGRRSSALKMKPTPPVPEVPPMKRARSSSRPSTLKRKVLMDDSMVLHGEYVNILIYHLSL